MSDKKNKDDIKKRESTLANGKDASSYLGSIDDLKNSNNIDPTIGGDDDDPLDIDVDTPAEPSSKSSTNDESSKKSAKSSESSDVSSDKSKVNKQALSSSSSVTSQTKKPSAKGDVEQVDGNNKDAAEDLSGNSAMHDNAFSINPYNEIRHSKVNMENALDILEKHTKDQTKPSADDMKKVYSLIRSSINKQSTAFEYLETQMHQEVQKIKGSVKVVTHRQNKISDTDPKANLQMLNEMAQRGIPQRLDEDFRMLSRILRNDPFFQKFKQENHFKSTVKPPKQFHARANKVKQQNVSYANRQAANKSVKSSTQTRS